MYSITTFIAFCFFIRAGRKTNTKPKPFFEKRKNIKNTKARKRENVWSVYKKMVTNGKSLLLSLGNIGNGGGKNKNRSDVD